MKAVTRLRTLGAGFSTNDIPEDYESKYTEPSGAVLKPGMYFCVSMPKTSKKQPKDSVASARCGNGQWAYFTDVPKLLKSPKSPKDWPSIVDMAKRKYMDLRWAGIVGKTVGVFKSKKRLLHPSHRIASVV